jgi:flagellar hook-length control protein FliK
VGQDGAAPARTAEQPDATTGMPGSLASTPGFSVSDTEATGSTTQTRPPVTASPVDQIKIQLGKGLKDGADTLSVQLHPEDMGRVDIKLEMQDGQVKATITADRPETLQMLKSDAGTLQQALNSAGLSADHNSLNFQLRGDQQQQQQQLAQQYNQTGDDGGRGARSNSGPDYGESDDGDTAATANPTARSGGIATNGGVDINV